MRQRIHLEKLLETSKSANLKLKRENDSISIELNKLKTEKMLDNCNNV